MKKTLTSSKNSLLALSVFLFPLITFGQTINCNGTSGLDSLFCLIQRTINSIIPILVSLAVLVFLFGVISYLVGKKSESKSEGAKYMIWGIISIFVMVSVWGLVGLVGSTIFGRSYGTPGSTTSAPVITTVPVPR